jgi:DNA-binding response OmpR family regulator
MANKPDDKKPVVLCVDDDTTLLDVMRIALEYAGCEVLTATDGRSALDVFSSRPIDAVVLDYNMPGMTGGEVAQEMKRRNPKVPKLLFTACERIPADASSAIEGFCSKPVDLRTLISRVKELIRRFRKTAACVDIQWRWAVRMQPA